MNEDALLKDIAAEFRKLKQQADRAIAQATPEELFKTLDTESNSIALLMKHLTGNLRSRWTNFLTTDGEKPDRNRDSEFVIEPGDTAENVRASWDAAWQLLFAGMESLRPEDLGRTVRVRGEPQSVSVTLFRQMAHHAGHVGQIILLAKHWAGTRWNTLTIPRGKSDEYRDRMMAQFQQHSRKE